MAKLIRSATECGYRHAHTCLYKEPFTDCKPKRDNNFPVHCPLEDGIIINPSLTKKMKKSRKEVISDAEYIVNQIESKTI